MWRLVFGVALLAATTAPSSSPHARDAHGAAFFNAHPQCVGKLGSIVGQLQCLPAAIREPLVSSIVYNSTFDKPAQIRLVVPGHTTEIVNLEMGERCVMHVEAARVVATSGEHGEMHVPALCNGHPGEFIWSLNGDHAHYVGYAPSAKVIR